MHTILLINIFRENFAGPVDFQTPRPDGPVHFFNFHNPFLLGVQFSEQFNYRAQDL